MNRNQIFTTIEFINDTIRMCIGEYFNEKFYVYDTFSCKCNGLEGSSITNEEEVTNIINQLLKSIKEKIEIIVEELILCLPGEHLVINDFTSTSPVTGKNYLINQYDINESYKVASKIRHGDDLTIVNIAPIEYQLDDGQKMDFAPIRYKSSTFKTLFNVYMLPIDILNGYLNAIDKAGVKTSKYYLDSDCLYSGVFEEDDISSAILNLDKYNTSFLIYKKGKLLDKFCIPFGTVNLEKAIEEQFEINDLTLISELLYNLGSCREDEVTNLSVCKNKNSYIKQQELNKTIILNLKIIFNNLINKAKDKIVLNDLDVYITGIGGTINGIETLFDSLSKCNSNVYISSTLGLNSTTFCETIGLIKLNYKKISQNKYINLQNNNYNDIMINKDKDSKFDKFILDEDDLD